MRAVFLLAAILVLQPSAQAEEHPLKLAVDALTANDYPTAVAHLEAALAKDPAHVEARFNLAFSYTQLGERDKAIEQYEKVLALKSDLPQALANVGILLLESERPAEAAVRFAALVELRPGEADPHFFLAYALAKADKSAEAILSFARVIELDPARADAHLGLGRAHARLGNWDAAAPAYLKAAEIDAELASVVLELAEALERAERTEQAIELYSAYSKTHPEDAAVLERTGFLLLDSNRGEEAIELLEQAVRMSPTPANRVALGEAYGRAGETERYGRKRQPRRLTRRISACASPPRC